MAVRGRKKRPFNAERDRKPFLINTLRRASFRWPARGEALKRARVSRGLYRCAMCFSACFKIKEIVLDHIHPVVDPNIGWTNFDDYCKRLLCDVSGFQVLCHPCHDVKTINENLVRTKSFN